MNLTAEPLRIDLIDASLTQQRARRIFRQGEDAAVWAMLAASQQLAEKDSLIDRLRVRLNGSATMDPSTPSGMVPIYAKPNAPRRKRRRKPGATPGHEGHHRPTPPRIDHHVKHEPLKCCPCCGEKVQPPRRYRKRIIEDIPHDVRVEATEHEIPRQWCGKCKKHVEPVVAEALPKSKLGHRVLLLTAWFHYGLGVTIEQVIAIMQHHLRTHLSAGGLVAMWRRLARILEPWYEQIGEDAKSSAHLHADETGWRVDGQTHWLWCFTNDRNCYYLIDRSRGSPALGRFFTESFRGVLITDFWRAYESVCADDRQYCLVHLLRELDKVDQQNDAPTWRAFAKKLRRLIRDGLRLRKRNDYTPARYASRIRRINDRLVALANDAAGDADADADTRRLGGRIARHQDYLFTFLDYPDVPPDNNFAERQIRPAVILRKNSQSNRSQRGAATQAVLMSIYRTLKLRDLPPIQTLVEALRIYLRTGQLPPLPDGDVADG